MKFSIILTLMLLAGCSSTASNTTDPRLTTNERCERSTGSHFCR